MSKIVFIGIDPSQNNTSIAFRFTRGGTVYGINLTKANLTIQTILEAFKAEGYLCYVAVERNTRRSGSWAASYAASCKAMREVVSSKATLPATRHFVGSQTWQSVSGARQTPVPTTVPKDKITKTQSLAWSINRGLDTFGDDNISDAYGVLTWLESQEFKLYSDKRDEPLGPPREVYLALGAATVLTT